MNDDKLRRQREAALKASERLANTLAKDTETKRKRRNGRLHKLGVLAEQMFLAGDLSLLSRFESVALEQFASRRFDRLDFELDDAMNWFDKTREEAMLRKSQKAEKVEATKASSHAGPTAHVTHVSMQKPAPAPAARPSSGSSNVAIATGQASSIAAVSVPAGT